MIGILFLLLVLDGAADRDGHAAAHEEGDDGRRDIRSSGAKLKGMRSPLAPREGISANRLRAPGGPQTHARQHEPVPETVGEWIDELFPAASGEDRADIFGDGQLCDETGRRVAPDDPVIPGGFYFFHRPVPAEAPIPFDYSVVFADEHLLVIDKPHFLASTPNGRFVRECVVTRARVDLGEPELVAIHRLDRVTAGLLILSRNPETRGRYQQLFQHRRVQKTYEALAVLPRGFDPAAFPLERRSRLDKEPGTRAMREVPGEPNAMSEIAYEGEAGARIGRFRLHPVTGRTHQLRVHMNGLGLPIAGDPVYPVDLAPDPYDFSDPLRLLAREIRFPDPLSGEERTFRSGLTLALPNAAHQDG